MINKNGFLLIELMIGLTVSIFLILIISHYIIEVKNKQQEALERAEALSLARNSIEKINAGKELQWQQIPANKKYSITTNIKKNFLSQESSLPMQEVIVSWKSGKNNRSVSLLSSSFSLPNGNHEK